MVSAALRHAHALFGARRPARAAARRRDRRGRLGGLRRERRGGGARAPARTGRRRGRRSRDAGLVGTSCLVMRPASPLPARRRGDVVRLGHLRAVGVAFCASGAAAPAARCAAALAAAAACWRGRRRWPALGCAGAAGVAAAAGAGLEHRQHFADLHVGAFLMLDLVEHAGVLGADFEIDLLGLELDERLAGGDRVALLLQPARDARFDDRFTELGNDDVDGHGILLTTGCIDAARLRGSARLDGHRSARTPARRSRADGSRAARRRAFRRARVARAADVAQRQPIAGERFELGRGRSPTRPCSPALPAPSTLRAGSGSRRPAARSSSAGNG